MRYLSFKIIAACILLPPVFYMLTVYLMERHFSARYARALEEVYLGDTRALLDGRAPLQEIIARNIEGYLKSRALVSLGLTVTVTVTTNSGRILYPPVYDQNNLDRPRADPIRTAQENYALMTAGLRLQAATRFEHNRLLSNSLLSACIILSLAWFYGHYRRASGRIGLEEADRRREIGRLQRLEQENTGRLEVLMKERERLRLRFEGLKHTLENEKNKAARNEDELIDEIDALEKKMNEHLLLQNSQQEEILKLQERLVDYEKDGRRGKKQKVKAAENAAKRFQTLYKNITISERAVRGFVDLTDELRLKAEEVIHQLNADAALVPVKRKVFGAKGRLTVLEVIFGYKGRLYFRNTEDRRPEILAIGTKNTQARELEYLAGL